MTVTLSDRKKELRILLDKMAANPSQDLSGERARVAILNQMVAAEAKKQGV